MPTRSKNNEFFPGETAGTGAGFTLVEILIAVFILAVVMATVMGTFTGVLSSAREAEKRADLYQTGRAVMDIITADVRCMLEKSEGRTGESADDAGVPAGPEGESEFVQTTLGSFITTNSLTMGRRQNPFPSEVSYTLKRNSQDNLFSIWRRVESPPDPPFDRGGREVPICRIVENFRLEIREMGAKREGSTKGLPRAVLVDFTLHMDDDRERFTTMVRPVVGD